MIQAFEVQVPLTPPPPAAIKTKPLSSFSPLKRGLSKRMLSTANKNSHDTPPTSLHDEPSNHTTKRFSIASLFTPPKESSTRKESVATTPEHHLSLPSLSPDGLDVSIQKLASIDYTSVHNSASSVSSEPVDQDHPNLFSSSSFQYIANNISTCNSNSTQGPATSNLNLPQQNENDVSHGNNSTLYSRRPSYKKTRSSAGPISRKIHHHKGEGYEEFKALDSDYHRFMSKTGVNKANVLRLALLPFLRQQRGEFFRTTPEEVSKRVRIFQKWWLGILSALRDRERPVSGMDRSAYLEAVSGIVARNEWVSVSGPMRETFECLIYDTLRYAIAKLSLKTVPITFAAFAGKIFAYAFFYAPGVASVLLHLLAVSKPNINRLLGVSFPNDDSPSNQYTDLESATCLVQSCFPLHISHLIAATSPIAKPPAPSALPEIYGPWARRWTCYNSDVFYSFFKHYYTIISHLVPAELPWNAHLASPGLIIIHSFLLGTLDSVVHPRKPASSLKTLSTESDFSSSVSMDMAPVFYGRRRVDQLKMLAAIREILHNDDACTPFFEPYCIQFEKIFHAVALRTSLYDIETCIILCDLVEELLSSLILSDAHTKHRMLIQKDNAIDWNFWILVVQRMLSGENVNTQLRALAFLFNVWDKIPISSTSNCSSCRNSCDHPRKSMSGDVKNESRKSRENVVFVLFDDQEGLRWNCTIWLLSPKLWKKYFCHWHPLVRAYYLRLICWRIASVGPESGLLSSVLYSNYNTDSRHLLEKRLRYTYSRFYEHNCISRVAGRPLASAVPCSPALNKQLRIIFNNASFSANPDSPLAFSPSGYLTPIEGTGIPKSSSNNATRRIDPYEVFDEIAYSFPTIPVPSDLLPSTSTRTTQDLSGMEDSNPKISRKSRSASTIESLGNLIKKKWSYLRNGGSSGNLKNYVSRSHLNTRQRSDNLQSRGQGSSISEYAPSLTSSSTMSSSYVRTPASGSSWSDARSPGSFMSLSHFVDQDSVSTLSLDNQSDSSTSLTMSLIPPPPQILRKRPEIIRSLYKFSLEYSDQTRYNRNNAFEQSQKPVYPLKKPVSNYTELVIPQLPFASESSGEKNGILNGYVSKSQLRLDLNLHDNGQHPHMIEEVISQYPDFLDSEDNDSDNEGAELQDSVQAEFEYSHLPAKERTKSKAADNTKYWVYGGRAINEWDLIMKEFQDFVKRNYTEHGAIRLEDIMCPFMIAEIPPKCLLGLDQAVDNAQRVNRVIGMPWKVYCMKTWECISKYEASADKPIQES